MHFPSSGGFYTSEEDFTALRSWCTQTKGHHLNDVFERIDEEKERLTMTDFFSPQKQHSRHQLIVNLFELFAVRMTSYFFDWTFVWRTPGGAAYQWFYAATFEASNKDVQKALRKVRQSYQSKKKAHGHPRQHPPLCLDNWERELLMDIEDNLVCVAWRPEASADEVGGDHYVLLNGSSVATAAATVDKYYWGNNFGLEGVQFVPQYYWGEGREPPVVPAAHVNFLDADSGFGYGSALLDTLCNTVTPLQSIDLYSEHSATGFYERVGWVRARDYNTYDIVWRDSHGKEWDGTGSPPARFLGTTERGLPVWRQNPEFLPTSKSINHFLSTYTPRDVVHALNLVEYYDPDRIIGTPLLHEFRVDNETTLGVDPTYIERFKTLTSGLHTGLNMHQKGARHGV